MTSEDRDVGHGFYRGGQWYSRTSYAWVRVAPTTPNGIAHQGHTNILKGKTDEEVMAYWDKRRAARTKRERARAARGGWSLAAYHWEAVTYPEFKKIPVTKEHARKLLKKFSRHFKTDCPGLSIFNRRGGGGHYQRFGKMITVGKNPTLDIVIHEYAHHLAAERNGGRCGHGKEFKRELKRVYTFAKRYLPKNDFSQNSGTQALKMQIQNT